jgi:hypothetical protein
MMRDASTLTRLLDANRAFALNGRGTTNHCPMALCALAAMGASDRRLEEFFAGWQKRRAIIPVRRDGHDSAALRRDYPGKLGELDAFGALRDSFAQRIDEVGADAIVREVLQDIPFAPASGAFHAMIRLAFGLEARHSGEIAAGLAALVCDNLALGIDLRGRKPAASAGDGLAVLSRALAGRDFAGGWITERLRAVAGDARFQAALTAAPGGETLFDDMALAALAIYRQTGDFTALHMVTGLHATRLVFARLPPGMVTASMPELWVAFCAAYVSIGAPAVIDLPASEAEAVPADWGRLFEAAVGSNDDHDIKFVYTCQRENLHRPTPHYYAAAAQRLAR